MIKISLALFIIAFVSFFNYAQEGNIYLLNHHYNEGIKYFESLLNKGTGDTGVYNNLMHLYYRKAELYKSFWKIGTRIELKYYDTKLQKQPKNYNPIIDFYKGICLFQIKDYSGSIKSFLNYLVLKKGENNLKSKALEWLGACEYKKGNVQKAENYWARVTLNNDDTKAELSFIYYMLNYKSDAADKLIENVKPEPGNVELNKDLLFIYSQKKDRQKINELLRYEYNAPALVVNKGKENTENFFDPSVFYSIYKASLYLSFFYANTVNSYSSIEQQNKLNTKYYRGIYFFENKSYYQCINNLRDADYKPAAAVLSAAYYLTGKINDAEQVVKNIYSWNNLKAICKLAALSYQYKLKNFYGGILTYFAEKYGEPSPPKNELVQKFYLYTGGININTGHYDEALKILSTGYIHWRPLSIEANPPDYMVVYSYLYLKMNNLDECKNINERLAAVTNYFPEVRQIRDAVTNLDILTSIGIEGLSGLNSK